jgi:hypothetical protein
MRHKKAVTKAGLILVLCFLVGAIAVAAPAPAVAGCAVVDTGTGTGVVVSCRDGQGLIVKIGEDLVKLVGLGPIWFWEAVSYERPQLGDEVTVWWNVVQCNNVEQNVLVGLDYDVTDNIPALELRDGNNLPLWNLAKRQIMRQQQLAYQHRTGQAD